MKYFLIVGCQRSGTTIVHVNLSRHPNIACLSDELRIDALDQNIRLFTVGNPGKGDPFESIEKGKGWKVIFEAITSIKATDKTLACGGKIAVTSRGLTQMLSNAIQKSFPELRIIFIERRDLVAQYASLKNAQKTNTYHSWDPSWDPSEREFDGLRIDKKEFTYYLQDCIWVNRKLLNLAETNPLHHCSYEDMLEDPHEFISKIYGFLRLQPTKFLNLMEKLAPPPEDYILNYLEMSKVLKEVRETSAKEPNTQLLEKEERTNAPNCSVYLKFVEYMKKVFTRNSP